MSEETVDTTSRNKMEMKDAEEVASAPKQQVSDALAQRSLGE